MYFLLNMRIFHCYVSLPEGIFCGYVHTGNIRILAFKRASASLSPSEHHSTCYLMLSTWYTQRTFKHIVSSNPCDCSFPLTQTLNVLVLHLPYKNWPNVGKYWCFHKLEKNPIAGVSIPVVGNLPRLWVDLKEDSSRNASFLFQWYSEMFAIFLPKKFLSTQIVGFIEQFDHQNWWSFDVRRSPPYPDVSRHESLFVKD